MARHTLPARAARQDRVDVHVGREDEVAERRAEDRREDEVRLTATHTCQFADGKREEWGGDSRCTS